MVCTIISTAYVYDRVYRIVYLYWCCMCVEFWCVCVCLTYSPTPGGVSSSCTRAGHKANFTIQLYPPSQLRSPARALHTHTHIHTHNLTPTHLLHTKTHTLTPTHPSPYPQHTRARARSQTRTWLKRPTVNGLDRTYDLVLGSSITFLRSAGCSLPETIKLGRVIVKENDSNCVCRRRKATTIERF